MTDPIREKCQTRKPKMLREDCYCEKHDAFCCPDCKKWIADLQEKLKQHELNTENFLTMKQNEIKALESQVKTLQEYRNGLDGAIEALCCQWRR